MGSSAKTSTRPVSSSSPVPRRGDLLEIDVDPEWIGLDSLPFDSGAGPLWKLLGRPDTILLTLPQSGEEVVLRPDAAGEILSGDGLGRLVGDDSLSLMLRLEKLEPSTVLSLVRPDVVAGGAGPGGAVPEGMAIHPGARELMAKAVSPIRTGGLPTRLHESAIELSLSQALDVLVSESLMREMVPFDYQRRVVRRVIGPMRGEAILADEVGLGKTIEAAMVLQEYLSRGLVRRTLVLTPPSLVGQWGEELRRHFGIAVVTQDDPEFLRAGAGAWSQFRTLVASLATARRQPHRSAILSQSYDLVIVDEAHHLRNSSTKSWKLVSEMKRRFLLLLSATPIQNDLSDLFSLVTLLKPGQLGTAREFKKRFSAPDGARNVTELRDLLGSVMIRNRRSDTGLELPPRRARTLVVLPSGGESRLYSKVTELVRGRYALEKPGPARTRLKSLQLLAGSSPAALASALARRSDQDVSEIFELMGSIPLPSKTERLLQVLHELGGEKAVIFSQFLATVEHLCGHLEEAHFTYRRFDGTMTRLQKDRAVDDFQNDVQLLVCTESGSEGRNLQFCRNLINFDLPWNPMRIEQRLGRLHRIGQTREVHVTNLVAQGTLEHDLIDVLERKLNLFELVVGEMDLILGDMEEDSRFDDLVFEAWANAADEAGARQSLEDIGDRLHEAKKALRFQNELNEAVFSDGLVTPDANPGPEAGDDGQRPD